MPIVTEQDYIDSFGKPYVWDKMNPHWQSYLKLIEIGKLKAEAFEAYEAACEAFYDQKKEVEFQKLLLPKTSRRYSKH